MIEFIILLSVAIYLLYRWATANRDFFQKRGLPYHKAFPLLGSAKDMVLRKKSFFDVICELYNMNDGKVYGIFDQRTPIFLIRDPEMIKQITIKDFDHFVNHRSIFDGTDLFSASLFLMQNDKWKDMRSTLSPFFTGSKLRQMFQLIDPVAQDTIKYLKQDIKSQDKENGEFDFKDICTRFTNDVIATTAFGIQVNSFEDQNNQFYKIGKKVTTFTVWQNIKFFIFANFKFLVKLFRMDLFDKESTDYFMHLVLDTMKYRKEHNIFRPDMINLLMEARGMIETDHPKTHNREWSDIDIVGQCFLFFFAGFETSAVLMCLTAHELMENPDVQQKLWEEVDEVSRELDGKPISYEVIQSMKYMDMVVSEVLRKWPAAVAVDRACNKDFIYEADGERFEIKKGESVWLPVCGIHRDPKYYENPNKFDPERFSDANKANIVPNTYLPFGLGPRNCIGSRFALLEAKVLIFYIVREFLIEASKRSTVPLVLSAASFQILPKNGFWLKFTPRIHEQKL